LRGAFFETKLMVHNQKGFPEKSNDVRLQDHPANFDLFFQSNLTPGGIPTWDRRLHVSSLAAREPNALPK